MPSPNISKPAKITKATALLHLLTLIIPPLIKTCTTLEKAITDAKFTEAPFKADLQAIRYYKKLLVLEELLIRTRANKSAGSQNVQSILNNLTFFSKESINYAQSYGKEEYIRRPAINFMYHDNQEKITTATNLNAFHETVHNATSDLLELYNKLEQQEQIIEDGNKEVSKKRYECIKNIGKRMIIALLEICCTLLLPVRAKIKFSAIAVLLGAAAYNAYGNYNELQTTATTILQNCVDAKQGIQNQLTQMHAYNGTETLPASHAVYKTPWEDLQSQYSKIHTFAQSTLAS